MKTIIEYIFESKKYGNTPLRGFIGDYRVSKFNDAAKHIIGIVDDVISTYDNGWSEVDDLDALIKFIHDDKDLLKKQSIENFVAAYAAYNSEQGIIWDEDIFSSNEDEIYEDIYKQLFPNKYSEPKGSQKTKSFIYDIKYLYNIFEKIQNVGHKYDYLLSPNLPTNWSKTLETMISAYKKEYNENEISIENAFKFYSDYCMNVGKFGRFYDLPTSAIRFFDNVANELKTEDIVPNKKVARSKEQIEFIKKLETDEVFLNTSNL